MTAPAVRDVLTTNPAASVRLFVDPEDGQWVAYLEDASGECLLARISSSPYGALFNLLTVPATAEATS